VVYPQEVFRDASKSCCCVRLGCHPFVIRDYAELSPVLILRFYARRIGGLYQSNPSCSAAFKT
jgi:hypothetical protein